MSQKVLVAIEEVEGLGDRLLEVKRKVRSLPAQLTAASVHPPFSSDRLWHGSASLMSGLTEVCFAAD